MVKNWQKPINIARYACGDIYKDVEMKIEGKGKCELVFTDDNGNEKRELIQNFDGDGIVLGTHNLKSSIESFARSCFNFSLECKFIRGAY